MKWGEFFLRFPPFSSRGKCIDPNDVPGRMKWVRGWWQPFTNSATGFATVAALATVLFVFLHYIGNQTPYAVVSEKIAAEFEAEPFAWGTRRRNFHNKWEYCYISAAVLAGARASATPVRDALLPPAIVLAPETGIGAADGGYCHALQRVVNDNQWLEPYGISESESGRMAHRQWFGAKALYAIGLRFLTVHQHHELIRVATYAMYAVLAAALLLVGWRALAVGSPVLMFGATLSGIEQLSDVAKGTPHVWAILTPALVALVLRLRSAAGTVRLFCFFAGMVASYLWSFDGGNFIAAALIGLVVWFHHAPLAPKSRAARAATCVFAHAAGFVVGVALSTLVKTAAAGGLQPAALFSAARIMLRIRAPEARDDASRDIGTWMEIVPIGVPDAAALIGITAITFGIAVAFAGYRAWRGDTKPLLDGLWISALGIGSLAHFALPNDLPFAASRLMYLPLALAWSVVVAVLLRTSRPVMHALAFLVLGGVLTLAGLLWQQSASTSLLKTIDSGPERLRKRALVHDHFNVYIQDHRLIYRRWECEDADLKRRFVLDLYPKHMADLPPERKAQGYISTTFYFIHHRWFTFSGDCIAIVDLPPFPIAKITTGNYCCYEGEQHWSATAQVDSPSPPAWLTVLPISQDGQLVFPAPFQTRLVGYAAEAGAGGNGSVDAGHAGLRLVLSSEGQQACAPEADMAPFHVHVFPWNADDLPAHSPYFHNADFLWHDLGDVVDGQCEATVPLPRWPIRRIGAGQHRGEEILWRVHIDLARPRELQAALGP